MAHVFRTGLSALMVMASASVLALEGCAADGGQAEPLEKAGRGSDKKLETELSVVSPGVVRMTLRNVGEGEVPSEDWFVSRVDHLVRVSRDGEPVEFSGPIVHTARDKSAPLTLQPGEELTRDIDLARHFAVRGTDVYSVTSMIGKTLTANDPDLEVTEEAKALSVEIEEASTNRQKASDGTCVPAWAQAIDDAQAGAHWLLNHALVNWGDSDHVSRRESWFGEIRPLSPNASPQQVINRSIRVLEHTQRVRSTINNMWQQADSSPPTASCYEYGVEWCKEEDGRRTLAYVFPNDSSRVYMCPGFFDLDHNAGETDRMGGQSQVGVMLHEYSHLHGADDVILFPDDFNIALSLARNRPEDASRSAVNYQFYLMGTRPGV